MKRKEYLYQVELSYKGNAITREKTAREILVYINWHIRSIDGA